ncbi:MAG: hypothetical protein ACR2HJ_03600 [Fimbriimonadales bacterium]
MKQLMSIPLFLMTAGGWADMYDDSRAIARTEVVSDPAFRIDRSGGDRGQDSFFYDATARRANRNSLLLTIYKRPDETGASSVWNALTPNLRTEQSNVAFSGLPVGAAVRQNVGIRGGCSIHAIDGLFVVKAHLSYSGSRPPEGGNADDKIICEGVARRSLARCRGLQAQSAQNINVNGTEVGSLTGPRGERLVDLVRYCEALNLEMTTNQRLGTASFTQGGEQVIIPLAALKIKDGPRWIETQDISLIKSGKWYVSYAGLEATR